MQRPQTRSVAWAATVVLTCPEGSSKGQEMLASFQTEGGSLAVNEERVLASAVGKLAPFGPLVAGWMVESHCPRSSETVS